MGSAYPRRSAPYAAYLTALVGRYGPKGSFWRENPRIPKMPIRTWQIWNEPNLAYYWRQPFAATYVSLLKVAHAAIKQADPGAKVVLGALTNLAWKSLGPDLRDQGREGPVRRRLGQRLHQDPGQRDAVHGVRPPRHGALRRRRQAAAGHRDQLAVGQGQDATPEYDFITTQAGQARNIATLLPLIGQQRLSLHLSGFYWYTWMGEEDPRTARSTSPACSASTTVT